MAKADGKQFLSDPRAPRPPRIIGETGLTLNHLIALATKTIYTEGQETAGQLSRAMKLNTAIMNSLLEEMKERGLVENLGIVGARLTSEFRFALTAKGRAQAAEAFAQSQYVGPVPVSIHTYRQQVERQRLAHEHIDRTALVESFEGLVVPETLTRRLGPAINSERSLLLYGAPGNGKTTLAEVIGELFQESIHIPYAIDVDGTVIKIFDPTLHHPVYEETDAEEEPVEGGSVVSLRVEERDHRWVECRRPLIITGGELTLDMLDLSFNPYARYYEAPLHMKAIGGTFVVDDLGRQLVRPEDLLNRWITPMEKRVDFLTLNTGKTFSIPFDVLLIFSTNLTPDDIMDPAFLRRIPYKVEVKAPTAEEFGKLMGMLCEDYEIELKDDVLPFVLDKLQNTYGQPLSFYQPKFIAQQAVAACKYAGIRTQFSEEILIDALENLSARSDDTISVKRRDGDEARGSGGWATSAKAPHSA